MVSPEHLDEQKPENEQVPSPNSICCWGFLGILRDPCLVLLHG